MAVRARLGKGVIPPPCFACRGERCPSVLADIVLAMDALAAQLTSRDAALLTWIVFALIAVAWSALGGGDIGRSFLSVVGAFFTPRVVGLVAIVAAWQALVVFLAEQAGLWSADLLKDTIMIVVVGAFIAGFKALALAQGKATMRDEVRSVVTLVVVVQFLANLQTFPYLVELVLPPIAVLLGGLQAVASHGDEYKAARPLINGILIIFGWCILAWSLYRVATSLEATAWETVGKSFALAFWLPATLLPAIYVAAVVMHYGTTISMMKVVRPPSLGARIDLYLHHGLNLRRLTAFARTPGRAREYARAVSHDDRVAILRAAADTSAVGGSRPRDQSSLDSLD